MLAPVVLFVYARPSHTIKTVEALEKNDLAKDSKLIIFSDGPKKESDIDKVEEVRDYINTLRDKNTFQSVEIHYSQINKGLANSVIEGVSQTLDKYGDIIVLEDDLVTSPGFLTYMNQSLKSYKNDHDIWSISGYTFDISLPKKYNGDIYLSYRGGSWGWATWKNRWDLVDWEVRDYHLFLKDKKAIKKFKLGGRDMARMLDSQMRGKIDSWAIRWCYTQSKLNKYSIYPTKSKVKNIGLDGSGTHSGKENKFDVKLNDCKINLSKPELDKNITKDFRKYFGSAFYWRVIETRQAFKRFLKMR
jgi:hypothetical protein